MLAAAAIVVAVARLVLTLEALVFILTLLNLLALSKLLTSIAGLLVPGFLPLVALALGLTVFDLMALIRGLYTFVGREGCRLPGPGRWRFQNRRFVSIIEYPYAMLAAGSEVIELAAGPLEEGFFCLEYFTIDVVAAPAFETVLRPMVRLVVGPDGSAISGKYLCLASLKLGVELGTSDLGTSTGHLCGNRGPLRGHGRGLRLLVVFILSNMVLGGLVGDVAHGFIQITLGQLPRVAQITLSELLSVIHVVISHLVTILVRRLMIEEVLSRVLYCVGAR